MNTTPLTLPFTPFRGLTGSRSYEVTFANTGDRSSARGTSVLHDGLTLALSKPDIVLLRTL